MKEMNNLMNQFINRQPEVLAQVLADSVSLEGLDLVGISDVIFIGSGSSINAAEMAARYFERYTRYQLHYFTPSAYAAWVAAGGGRHLVVVISQTATSIASMDCITLGQEQGCPTLLISATTDAQKRGQADIFLDLFCPEETIGPKSVGVMATFTRLVQLALALARISNAVTNAEVDQAFAQLQTCIEAIATVKENSETWVQTHEQWATLPYVTVSADINMMAVANEGALKLLETLCKPATAYEIGEFTHGPHRLINTSSFHILIANDAADVLSPKVAQYIKKFTPNCLYLSLHDSDIDLVVTEDACGVEILYSVVFQVLANRLALLTGFNPDDKVHAEFFGFVGTKSGS